MEIFNIMKKNNKLIIILVLFLTAALLFFIGHKPVLAPETLQTELKTLKLNGSDLVASEARIFKVEIADTDEKRMQGLSGRESLPENQGMLFVFDVSDYHTFWMKDMNFSLDFIWISRNQIVEISRNIKPEDYQPPKTLVPGNKIDKVLEVNAGFAEKIGIKEGDKLEF
jgi:hypothetical protein